MDGYSKRRPGEFSCRSDISRDPENSANPANTRGPRIVPTRRENTTVAGWECLRSHIPEDIALRKDRCSLAGQIYLITFATVDRGRIFEDPGNAAIVARAVEDPRLWYRSRLLAWVLMPDHWHGLIELGPMEDISIVVQRLKTNTARMLRRPGRESAPVWARGFHDRALRADESVRIAARHLIANPLRAGLVERIGDYPYWNAVWL